ncbi:isoprenyl transferase [Alkalicoccus chagannorensis]|uniref:isoprenyl transferase n=1 Tax=Alkalicoccus chagannorensis TaxID=427072 RepID=UPI00040BDCD9|nr:isoprenyl transferase [Alkalicoccus chagannorensis]
MLNKLIKKRKGLDEADEASLLEEKVPDHIAIIMDGNGRWAKQRGMPRVAGHREGMSVIRSIVQAGSRLGVKTMTLYAFSTENWKRPRTEVDFLMRLPERFLSVELPKMMEDNVIVRITGDVHKLPQYTQDAVHRAVHETSGNTGMILNFALNYGSRSEILDAFHAMYEDVEAGVIAKEDVSEALVSDYLMTNGLREPDLLIRTSGEKRLSNFMLWQLAYSEFWFTDVLWPDFTPEHLKEAIEAYQQRQRRYGGV